MGEHSRPDLAAAQERSQSALEVFERLYADAEARRVRAVERKSPARVFAGFKRGLFFAHSNLQNA